MFLQVCRSWRKLAEDEIFWLLRSRGSKSIVLMQPTIFVEHNVCKSKVDILNFGDYIFSDEDDPIIIEEKGVTFCGPPHLFEIICSCRGGWTVLMQNKTKDLEIWNSFVGVKLRLPCYNYPSPSVTVKAATFFGDFGIGAAVIRVDGKVAFAKYGDCKWSVLCETGHCEDLIASKDAILALFRNERNGELLGFQAWNFQGTNIVDVKLDFPRDVAETIPPNKYKHKLYIGESRGKVFLIVRSLENLLQVSICNYYRTVNFYVYTLNEDKSGWNRVKTLGNLSFFIGKNQTIMLQPKDFPGCQNNSIYFTSHYQERLLLSENIWEEYYYDFMGFYCLEDSSMHKSRRKFQNIFPSTWIISGV